MSDAELRLAIASCRAVFTAEPDADLGQVARGVSWDRFLKVAERHRIQALCREGLESIRSLVPAVVADRLRREARIIVESNLRMASESARLLDLFRSAGLPLLFLKGLTLDALAYPRPFLKMSWDIDLLVAPDRIEESTLLLGSAGYQVVTPASGGEPVERWHETRKESVWHHAQGGFYLDLHTRLADNPALLPHVGTGSPSQIVRIANGIELPTLAKDELFAYLAVHGASSAWFRLKWITDLAAMLHGESTMEIERLYDRSRRLGAGRAAGQALLLGQWLYAIDIGDGLTDRLDGDPVNRWLAGLAERQLASIAEPTERPLGTATIHLSQPFLLPGWRFKLSEISRQLKDMMGRAAI